MNANRSELVELHAQYMRVRAVIRHVMHSARKHAIDAELQACGHALAALQSEGVIVGYEVDFTSHVARVHLRGAAEHIVLYMEL